MSHANGVRLWKIVRMVALVGLLVGAALMPAMAATVQVTYGTWGNEQELQRFRELAELFNSQNDQIHVEIVHIAGDYNSVLLTQLAAGVAPDSFHLGDGFAPQLARQGLLEDLLPYLERDPELSLDDFFPPMVTLGVYGGRVYGLPPDENPIVTYVNLDMFARAGLPSPIELDRDDQWTWSAFREAAQRLSRTSSAGEAESYGYFVSNWWAAIMPFVWGGGGDFFSPSSASSTLTDERALMGLELLHQMIHEDRSASHVLPDDVNALFHDGRVAMHSVGRWIVPYYRDFLQDVNWDVVPMPQGPAGRVTAIAGAFSGINAQSPHKEAAWQWLRFFVGPEGQRFRLGGSGNAVPSIRGLEDTVYGGDQVPPNARAFLDGVIYGRPLSVEMAVYSQMQGLIFGALDRAWHGQTSPRLALEEIQDQVDALLAQRLVE